MQCCFLISRFVTTRARRYGCSELFFDDVSAILYGVQQDCSKGHKRQNVQDIDIERGRFESGVDGQGCREVATQGAQISVCS